MTSLFYQGLKGKIITHCDAFFLFFDVKMQSGDTHASPLNPFHCRQNTPTVILQLIHNHSSWQKPEMQTPKSFAALHLLSLCSTVAKFCLQKSQKRQDDPGGPIVSAHPHSAALSAAVTFIPPQGCEIFFLNTSMLHLTVELE